MALHHKHEPSGKEGQHIWRLSHQAEHLISFIIRHLAFIYKPQRKKFIQFVK